MNRRIASISLIVSSTALLLLLAGCDKEEPVTAYSAPKEPALIQWVVPEGWKSTTHNQRLTYAAFTTGEGDEPAKVTISFLFPNVGGARDLLLNVNRWRGQMKLDPIAVTELASAVNTTTEGGLTTQSVEVIGSTGQEMRAIIVPREDRIWFFKLTGTVAEVDEQKAKFEAFVHDVKYQTPAGAALVASASSAGDMPAEAAMPAGHPPVAPTVAAPVPAPASDGSELTYALPTGWTRQPNANPMRVATISTGGDKPAQIIVTRLSGNFGGMLMNLTRWRGEVGLPPAESTTDLKETPVKVGPVDGSLIDLAGPGKGGATPMRSLIARCPQGDSVWFFKILGPAESVTQQQAAFVAFLESVKLPGEPVK